MIWERVRPASSELVGRIQKWIEERPGEWLHIRAAKKEVEFIPATWNKMLPSAGKSNRPDRWMVMLLQAWNTQLRLIVLVCPTTDVQMRKLVLERLLRDKNEFGFTAKKLTNEWTTILSEEVCELPDDGKPEDIETVIQCVEKRLEEFLTKTATLPAAMKVLFPV